MRGSDAVYKEVEKEPARAGGPRRIYYYLIDSKGNKTLCMMGEERDKNDSHYIYRTVGVFDQLKPYTCGNNSNAQKYCNEYLNQKVIQDPLPSGTKAGARASAVAPSATPPPSHLPSRATRSNPVPHPPLPSAPPPPRTKTTRRGEAATPDPDSAPAFTPAGGAPLASLAPAAAPAPADVGMNGGANTNKRKGAPSAKPGPGKKRAGTGPGPVQGKDADVEIALEAGAPLRGPDAPAGPSPAARLPSPSKPAGPMSERGRLASLLPQMPSPQLPAGQPVVGRGASGDPGAGPGPGPSLVATPGRNVLGAAGFSAGTGGSGPGQPLLDLSRAALLPTLSTLPPFPPPPPPPHSQPPVPAGAATAPPPQQQQQQPQANGTPAPRLRNNVPRAAAIAATAAFEDGGFFDLGLLDGDPGWDYGLGSGVGGPMPIATGKGGRGKKIKNIGPDGRPRIGRPPKNRPRMDPDLMALGGGGGGGGGVPGGMPMMPPPAFYAAPVARQPTDFSTSAELRRGADEEYARRSLARRTAVAWVQCSGKNTGGPMLSRDEDQAWTAMRDARGVIERFLDAYEGPVAELAVAGASKPVKSPRGGAKRKSGRQGSPAAGALPAPGSQDLVFALRLMAQYPWCLRTWAVLEVSQGLERLAEVLRGMTAARAAPEGLGDFGSWVEGAEVYVAALRAQWKGILREKAYVLTDPRMLLDPVSKLESLLSGGPGLAEAKLGPRR